MDTTKLDEILERIGSNTLPPVHLWDPPLTGELDMRIASDGSWYYQGGLIGRASMVKLFSGILKSEAGEHFLITPVEKYRIQVEDAPFVAVEVDQIIGETPSLLFRTNVDDEVIADTEHPLVLHAPANSSNPRPYLEVRNGLKALVHRNVFYQLVEWSKQEVIEGIPQAMIYSRGQRFSLGVL